MSANQMTELERREEELKLKQIEGKPKNIEINERTLEAYRKGFSDKGLQIEWKDYPTGGTGKKHVAKQKAFDALVDATQPITKKIGAMVRQPVTVIDKQGKQEVKDALYYYGGYFGFDKRGNEINVHFDEGWYLKPKLRFQLDDSSKPYDPVTGERRGRYLVQGQSWEHYIFLPENKADRKKFLEDLLKTSVTSPDNLAYGAHLSYRQAHPENNHTSQHGGQFNWSQFCDLSLRELGEVQQTGYYKEEKTGLLKDGQGRRVKYDDNTGKLEAIK